MFIHEARQLKADLQKSIRDQIAAFEELTGMYVESVVFIRDKVDMDLERVTLNVKL